MTVYTYQRAMPPKLAVALEFIRREVQWRGQFPTPQAIARYMGYNEASAHDLLLRLVTRGAVIRTPATAPDKRRRYAYSLPAEAA